MKKKVKPKINSHYYEVILSASVALNASRAVVNLSVTTSQRSIRESRPFSKASTAFVVSGAREKTKVSK